MLNLLVYLRDAMQSLDAALVGASDELIEVGFSERSARSVVQHLERARQDLEDVLLLVCIFAKTDPPRGERGG